MFGKGFFTAEDAEIAEKGSKASLIRQMAADEGTKFFEIGITPGLPGPEPLRLAGHRSTNGRKDRKDRK